MMQGTPGRGRGLTVDFSEDIPFPSSFFPRSRRSITPPNQKLRPSSHMKLAANFGSDQVHQRSLLASLHPVGTPGPVDQQLKNMVQDFQQLYEQKHNETQNEENQSPPLHVQPAVPRGGQPSVFKKQQHQQVHGQIKILQRPRHPNAQVIRQPLPQMHPLWQMIQEQPKHQQRQPVAQQPLQQVNQHLQVLYYEQPAYDGQRGQQQQQEQSCSWPQQLQQQGQNLQNELQKPCVCQGEQQQEQDCQQGGTKLQLQRQDQHMQQKGPQEQQASQGKSQQQQQQQLQQQKECLEKGSQEEQNYQPIIDQQQQKPSQQQERQQQEQQQQERQQQERQQQERQQQERQQQERQQQERQQQERQQQEWQQQERQQQARQQQERQQQARQQQARQQEQEQQQQQQQEQQQQHNDQQQKQESDPQRGQPWLQQLQQQVQHLQKGSQELQADQVKLGEQHERDQQQQQEECQQQWHQQQPQEQQWQELQQHQQQQQDQEQQYLRSVTKNHQTQHHRHQGQQHTGYKQTKQLKRLGKRHQQEQKGEEQQQAQFKWKQYPQHQWTGKNQQQHSTYQQQDIHAFSNQKVQQGGFPGITSPPLPGFSPTISPPPPPTLLQIDTSKPPPPIGIPIPGLPMTAQGPLPTQLWSSGAADHKPPHQKSSHQDPLQPYGGYPTKTPPLNEQRPQHRSWEFAGGGDSSAFAAMQDKVWDEIPLGGGYASGTEGYQSPQAMCPSNGGDVPLQRKGWGSPSHGDNSQQRLAREGTQGQKQWQKKDKTKRRGNTKQDHRGMGMNRANSPSQGEGTSSFTKAHQESSNLSKEQAKNEYEWQSFKIVRKVRKVLGCLKDGGSTTAATEIVNIMKEESARLASFPWPKEQFVVLDEILAWVMDRPEMVEPVCNLIEEIHCQHAENFQEDLINTMMKRHAQFIKVSSATNKVKFYSSYSSILGNLFILSKSANKSFQETTYKLMDVLVYKWMMRDIQEIDKEQIEVYKFCLRALFTVIGPQLDSEMDQKYNKQLRDQVLGNQPRTVKEALLDLLLMRAAGWKSSAEVKTDSSVNSKVKSTDDASRKPEAEGGKNKSEDSKLPKGELSEGECQSKELEHRSTLSETISGERSARSQDGTVSKDNLDFSVASSEALKTDLDQTKSESKSEAKDSSSSSLQNSDSASLNVDSSVNETTDKFKLPNKEVAERGAIVLSHTTTQQSCISEDMGDRVHQHLAPFSPVPSQVYASPPDPWPAMYVSAFSEMQAGLSASTNFYHSEPFNPGPVMTMPSNPLQNTDVSFATRYSPSSSQINLSNPVAQPTNVEFAVPFMPLPRSSSSAFIPGRLKVPCEANPTPTSTESYLKPPEAFSAEVHHYKTSFPNTDIKVDAHSTSKPKTDDGFSEAAALTRQQHPRSSVSSPQSQLKNSQTTSTVTDPPSSSFSTTTASSLSNARPTSKQSCKDSEISEPSHNAGTKPQTDKVISTRPLSMNNNNHAQSGFSHGFKDEKPNLNYRLYSPQELTSEVTDDPLPAEGMRKQIHDVQLRSTQPKDVFRGLSQRRIDNFWEEESDSTTSECEQQSRLQIAPPGADDVPECFIKWPEVSQEIRLESFDVAEDLEQEPESGEMKGRFSPTPVAKSQRGAAVALGRGMMKRENGNPSKANYMCGIFGKFDGHSADTIEHPRGDQDTAGYLTSERSPLPEKPDSLESNACGPSVRPKVKTGTDTDKSGAFTALKTDDLEGNDAKTLDSSLCQEKPKGSESACEVCSPGVINSQDLAPEEEPNEKPTVHLTSPMQGQNSLSTKSIVECQKTPSVVCPLCGSKNHRTRQCTIFKKYAPRAKSSETEPEPETQEVQKLKALSEFGKRVFCSKCREEGHLNYDCPVGGGFNIFH